jgi:hypothetical protein
LRVWCPRGQSVTADWPGLPFGIRERAKKSKLGHFDWSEWKSYRDEDRL